MIFKLLGSLSAILVLALTAAFAFHYDSLGWGLTIAAAIIVIIDLVIWFGKNYALISRGDLQKLKEKEVMSSDAVEKETLQATAPSADHALKDKPDAPTASNGEAEAELTKITPSAIVSEVRNARPFQRDHLADSYVGLPVSWRLQFYKAERTKIFHDHKMIDAYRIVTNDAEDTIVTFEVSTEEAKRLSFVQENDSVLVQGSIEKVDSWIRLKDASIKLL